MKMPFERVSSCWVRYDKYEIRKDAKGVRYVTAAEGTKPHIFDPLADSEAVVLAALNVGIRYFNREIPNNTREAALLDKPTIVWDFHSLLLVLQMVFSFMITEDTAPLRICDHCGMIFSAKPKTQRFCCDECRNKGN